MNNLIDSLRVDGLLSFAPNSDPFKLEPLNILIGANGSGKSNVIEVMELLHATPTNFASAIRDGGGVNEWIWKGPEGNGTAEIELETGPKTKTGRPLRYRLKFTPVNARVEVLDEAIEELSPRSGHDEPFFYYRFQEGHPVINVSESESDGRQRQRRLRREDLLPDQSVLKQRKDPEAYPELTWLANSFDEILIFRDWRFGRYAAPRQPQPTDSVEHKLLPDASNLALVINNLEHRLGTELNDNIRRFFPRFERLTTRLSNATAQLWLHEEGFDSPIPSTRLSDGTIRFIALLAILLDPVPPPLICIEEPELGLHPDAIAQVAELLIDASDRTQLIVTTHSEALVSALTSTPKSLVVCERPGAGTELTRLDPERLDHWLTDHTLGDLWRIGELGGNP